MIPLKTPPGSPVRVHWPERKTETGDVIAEHDEDTFTICDPFELTAVAGGLDGIAAGTWCVYVADLKIAALEHVQPREGIHMAPGYRWGVFAENAKRKWWRKWWRLE